VADEDSRISVESILRAVAERFCVVEGDDDNSTPAKRYLKEREGLIDAARESARTFDKAVLTFGAAVFGFSIAFLKDVALHPMRATLPWLGTAWGFFSFGLLFILLSFLVWPPRLFLRD
jgi:hypothetical protein